MLGFAVILVLYTQATDNSLDINGTVYSSVKLCREEGERLVGLKLQSKLGNGKPVRSVWYSCQTVRGKAGGPKRPARP
ncbi:hypothetical protein [Aureimonas psammosilenae]|uniref:hypothetical protein n=1 Tax=Aureimonas psammosilenae TaxID=2495496 RepID=UPI001260A44D|nr:hypothetical protein [Aureimonas psammosilenae]